MSRNTKVVVECANCGSDFADGTVGNRRHSKYCPDCEKTYGNTLKSQGKKEQIGSKNEVIQST